MFIGELPLSILCKDPVFNDENQDNALREFGFRISETTAARMPRLEEELTISSLTLHSITVEASSSHSPTAKEGEEEKTPPRIATASVKSAFSPRGKRSKRRSPKEDDFDQAIKEELARQKKEDTKQTSSEEKKKRQLELAGEECALLQQMSGIMGQVRLLLDEIQVATVEAEATPNGGKKLLKQLRRKQEELTEFMKQGDSIKRRVESIQEQLKKECA